jgi:hypothetical protein
MLGSEVIGGVAALDAIEQPAKSLETSGHAPQRTTDDENLADVFPTTWGLRHEDFRGSLDAADTSVRAT